MMRFGVLALFLFAAACKAQPPLQIRALVDSGKLDEAERLARSGGIPMAAALGEVLVMRGKLAAADSAFRVAVERAAPGYRSAEAGLAELSYRHGDRTDALKRARALTSSYEQGATRWSADDHIAAGRAYVILGTQSAASVRAALAAFDNAIAADRANVEARLRVGDLFLERYNAPDAKSSFDEVLRADPKNARAMLGLAHVAQFEGKREAQTLARASVAANPALADAHVLLSSFHLEAEAYDSATTEARLALATDSASMSAWSLLGAAAWLKGETAEFDRAKAMAGRLNPRPAEFYVRLAEAAIRQRRYDDGLRLANEALALDSTSVAALGILGTNQLRAGKMEEGRVLLERAFAADPFDLRNKNTLDFLDELRKFRTIDRGRFRIVAPPKEADLLTIYLLPLLEQAFDTLSKRYGYTPPLPVRLEIYDRHADFSVRTVGLAGLGALGVSFGPVLAMDAPGARNRGEFNWGSTAWHELAHTFTLGLSNNKAPRWLSEGLSVLEERRARPEWGAKVSVEFLAAYLGGRIRPPSQLNDGFVRPRYDAETIFSYYDASLVCEMIEEQRGSKAFVDMLKAYRDGSDTPGVFAKVLGLKPAELDAQFDTWLRAKFAAPLAAISPNEGKGELTGSFITAVRAGADLLSRNQPDSAKVELLRAQTLFPGYAGSGSPAVMLSKIASDRGDFREALRQVLTMTSANETTWEGNLIEAGLRERLGDTASARVPLERLIWISPYDISIHERLAEVAAKRADFTTAIRERRAILALNPSDALDARFQLARALADGGDVAGARKELLAVLEQAPSFEKAQTLLLELRRKSAP